MTRSIQSLTRSLYGFAFLGALTFGAAEAFATPGQPRNEAEAPYCDLVKCQRANPGASCHCSPFVAGECICIPPII